MEVDPIDQSKHYLSLFQVDDNQYVIGVFQKGITFYKQQLRALNIFYGLMKTGVLVKPDGTVAPMKICVIGAGVAGLTFAAAALKTGFIVTILEKKSMFLPMQHGCETRKIHPNIYDWPDKDEQSLSPYAKIPVLSWKYDTAAEVASQIRNGFEEICEEFPSQTDSHVDCTIDRINRHSSNKKIIIEYRSRGANLDCVADVLIYAPGYGVELGVDSKHMTPSYWRNDDFGQPLVTSRSNETKSFCISGVGDGALMDLFRIKIRDFDLDTLFAALKSEPKKYENLKQGLLKIKEDWADLANKEDPKWLGQRFQELKKNVDCEYIVESYITPRFVKNKLVTVLGSAKFFDENLSLRNVSLLNSFLAFLLWKMGEPAFAYKQVQRRNRPIKGYDQPIIRHGTDRRAALKKLFIPTGTISQLYQAQTKNALYENSTQLWKYANLVAYFKSTVNHKRIEYFRPETLALCSSFIAMLSRTLNNQGTSNVPNLNFGMALYRVLELEGELFYQQVTYYFRDKALRTQGTIGSVYPINEGTVGLSFLTGRSFLLKKGTLEEMKEIKSFLNHRETFDIPDRQSFLTLPILAKNDYLSRTVNLVLFIDSNSSTALENETTIKMTFDLLNGLVEALKGLLKFRQIHMSDLSFKPNNLQSVDLNNIKSNIMTDLSGKYSFLLPEETTLLLDAPYSFDIFYNNPAKFN